MDKKTKESKTPEPVRVLDLSGRGPAIRTEDGPGHPKKTVRFVDLSGPRPKTVPVVTKTEKNRRPRSRKKLYTFHGRYEFAQHIRYLDPARAEGLDKLRDDLQEAIERVIRVNGAFVKQLNTVAAQSNRVKHVIKKAEEIPFLCTVQRKIVAESVTTILESNAVRERRRHEEEEATRREIDDASNRNRWWVIPDKSN